jgi:hypothetical protein
MAPQMANSSGEICSSIGSIVLASALRAAEQGSFVSRSCLRLSCASRVLEGAARLSGYIDLHSGLIVLT